MTAAPLSGPAALLTASLLLLVLLFQSPPATTSPSVYEALQQFNFPKGLLPKGVTGYELDRDTGKFCAFLNGSCSFYPEGSYQIKYEPTIRSYISENRLTGLSGVSINLLFRWLDIVEVTRFDDELEFSVGIPSMSFPVGNFYGCPQCGCGFDCANEVRTSPGSGVFSI